MKNIRDYLPVEGAVVRLGTSTDHQGRAVTTWACPGCPATVRSLSTNPQKASDFITRYASHPVECTFHQGAQT